MFNYSNINETFGLVIKNININKTTDENHKQLLLSLFYKYSIMIIPNQDIGKKDLINFTSIFGDPIEHPTNIKNRDIEFPQITIISNIKKNGFEIGALGSEGNSGHEAESDRDCNNDCIYQQYEALVNEIIKCRHF